MRTFTIVWSALAGLGLAKACAGLIAWATIPAPLAAVNYAGVPRWCQLAACVSLAAAAALIWGGTNPVRVSWAAAWALGAAAFGRVPLRVAGWWDPPVELALWAAVPVAVVLPLAVAMRPALNRRHRVATVIAGAGLAIVAAAPLAPVTPVYWGILAVAVLASVVALQRRRTDG